MPILAYYNPQKEMILQTDASSKGLGACLLQEGKPIYFASKTFTEAQQGYVAIKLESWWKHGPWKNLIISSMATTSY